MCDSKVKIWD